MVEKFVEQQAATPPDSLEEIERLLTFVRRYMNQAEVNRVIEALHLAQKTCKGVIGTRPIPPLEHALTIATILAQLMHVDAVGISAGLISEAVDADLLSLEEVERALGGPTARIVGSMARLNILERKKQSVAGANALKGGEERDESGRARAPLRRRPSSVQPEEDDVRGVDEDVAQVQRDRRTTAERHVHPEREHGEGPVVAARVALRGCRPQVGRPDASNAGERPE